MSTPANPLTSQQAPSDIGAAGGGFFNRIGSGLKTLAPYLPGIANRVAAAFGNYRPLMLEQQQQELGIRNKLAQSTLDTQALTRTHLQQENENYQTPQQRAQMDVNVKRAETPAYYQTNDNQTGVAEADLAGNYKPRMVNVPNPEIGMDKERTEDFNRNFPGGSVPTAPPTMPSTVSRPAIMPQQVGFHLTGLDSNNNPIVMEYGKGGAPMGSAPAPINPNNPIVPGMGKVNALDAGAVNALPPDPRSYPQGARDPKFRTDYQAFLKSAADTKQANAIKVAGARGAAFNASKPITTLSDEGQDVISTLGDERSAGRGTPEHPILAGNQAGAAGLGQKRATFAEIDKNLANVRQYLPSLQGIGYQDRLALGTMLTPGTGMISHIAESAAESRLSPDLQQLIFTIRNLRQGATSLKNVLSSNGVSDKRIAILESELPNEADLMTGDPATVERKLTTFESVYREVAAAYPQLMSKGSAGRPPAGPLAPPTMPGQPKILVEGRDF